MKIVVEAVKSTLVGGLFVLMPLLILYLVVAEAVELIIVLATPIADLFPRGTFDTSNYKPVFAVLLILGTALLIGTAMRSALAIRCGRIIERYTLNHLPMYRTLRQITRGFVDSGSGFRLAVFEAQAEVRELVFVVEDPGDGFVTILRPHAPSGFAGPVGVVPRERVTTLDATIGDGSLALNNWGVGLQALLEKRMDR